MVNKNLYIPSALCLLALIVLSACGSAASAAPTLTTVVPAAATVAPASAATQAPVSQNTVGTGSSNVQWPSQMPADVPVFTYGTITGSSNNIMGNIQGAFDNVSADAFTKYQSDLKNAGWTITVANQSASGFEIDATKTGRTVVAMFISTKKTGLTGAVTFHTGQ